MEAMTEQKTTVCANCEREVPALWESGGLADSGLFFDPNTLGYYAGFFDNFPPADDGFCICHDCSVVFMKALPGLAKRLLPLRGGHPMDDSYPNPPCCEWAWAWDESEVCEKHGVTVLRGNDEGGWDRRKCPCAELES